MELVKRANRLVEEQSHEEKPAGLAVWLLAAFSRIASRGWGARAAVRQRELKLVETLPLGGRRQLMLVSCAGKQYLVGAGADSITSMIPVAGGASHRADTPATQRSEPWM